MSLNDPTHPDNEKINEQVQLFDEVRTVVSDPIRFKLKLGIGADAYLSLKVTKYVQDLWDIGGVAATGAKFAASSSLVTGYFVSSSWLSAFGLGAAATTPVGWVIGAAVVSAAGYYGVTRVFRRFGENRVDQIPAFINTPIDLLGANLVDLIAPLAIKIATIDNDYDPRERETIRTYFTDEWGIDPNYLDAALSTIEQNISDASLQGIVTSLAHFKKKNPDCNYAKMSKEILVFLREVAESDHHLDEREEMALERVERVLQSEGRLKFSDITGYLPRLPWR